MPRSGIPTSSYPSLRRRPFTILQRQILPLVQQLGQARVMLVTLLALHQIRIAPQNGIIRAMPLIRCDLGQRRLEPRSDRPLQVCASRGQGVDVHDGFEDAQVAEHFDHVGHALFDQRLAAGVVEAGDEGIGDDDEGVHDDALGVAEGVGSLVGGDEGVDLERHGHDAFVGGVALGFVG